VTPEVGDVRFTQTEDAFYILSLSSPAEAFFIDAPLPILPGDTITMIGAGNDTKVAWRAVNEGVVITVSTAVADAGKYCWVFKIQYSTENIQSKFFKQTFLAHFLFPILNTLDS